MIGIKNFKSHANKLKKLNKRSNQWTEYVTEDSFVYGYGGCLVKIHSNLDQKIKEDKKHDFVEKLFKENRDKKETFVLPVKPIKQMFQIISHQCEIAKISFKDNTMIIRPDVCGVFDNAKYHFNSYYSIPNIEFAINTKLMMSLFVMLYNEQITDIQVGYDNSLKPIYFLNDELEVLVSPYRLPGFGDENHVVGSI